MSRAIAADIGQMDSVLDAAHVPRLDVVAGLIGAFEHTETLAAILQHFRHEGHCIQSAFRIKSGEDLLLTAYLDKFPREKIQAAIG